MKKFWILSVALLLALVFAMPVSADDDGTEGDDPIAATGELETLADRFHCSNFLAAILDELGVEVEDLTAELLADLPSLNVSDRDITCLVGVELLVNLTELVVDDNPLVVVDLSENINIVLFSAEDTFLERGGIVGLSRNAELRLGEIRAGDPTEYGCPICAAELAEEPYPEEPEEYEPEEEQEFDPIPDIADFFAQREQQPSEPNTTFTVLVYALIGMVFVSFVLSIILLVRQLRR